MKARLEPEVLWRCFEELSRIPRDSKQEALARNYVVDRARALGLDYRVDRAGNVLVVKPCRQNEKTVVLQAHLDMVCEKDRDTGHDFSRDPIQLVRDKAWVRAQGTTLGADNGIGVAAMLAIMEDKGLNLPRLELLFTVDEETGLTGAMLMEAGLLTGKTFINLDSEQEGTIIVGCAGGRDTSLRLTVSRRGVPDGYEPCLVRVGGLKGGHSGTDIHTGRGNAVYLLARSLMDLPVTMHLATIAGGNKHNAIPREAEAVLMIRPEDRPALLQTLDRMNAVFAREFKGIDENVRLTVEPAAGPESVMAPEDARRILNLLVCLPHGLIDVDMERGAVISSTNLAVCSTQGDTVTIATSQRSTLASRRDAVASQVAALGSLAGAHVAHNHVYPAWPPDYDSALLTSAKGVYRSLFGKTARIKVIHAGLECGVIGDKIPGIAMISIGPTIEQAHSPYEKVNIRSVERFWQFLIRLLEELAVNPRAS
jgi:dipeptidase D